MRINLQHRLEGDNIRYLESPNYDTRCTNAIDLIVIHCISLPEGCYGNDCVEKLFTNQLDAGAHKEFGEIKGLRVSSHIFIRRDGAIIQFVPFDKRAWHAGESEYKGRSKCNDFSVGIELEGTDNTSFEAIQYQRLEQLIDTLKAHYSEMNKLDIVGHNEIAPGRKKDPGKYFEWQRFRKSAEV